MKSLAAYAGLFLTLLHVGAQLPPTEFGEILFDRYPQGLALRWFAPTDSFWTLERASEPAGPWSVDQFGEGIGQTVARMISTIGPSSIFRVRLDPILKPVCIEFEWDANPEPDILTYRIYWGEVSHTYAQHVETGDALRFVLCDQFKRGHTYFFALTAINFAGLESDFSDELAYTISAP